MKEKFAPEDWEELKILPFIVFNMVAAADGKIDEKEAAQVVQELQSAPMLKNPLHRELMLDIAQSNAPELLKKSLDGSKLEQRVSNAKSILKKALSHDEYSEFLGSLIISGRHVAEASGGGLLGLGDKVSDEEKKVLMGLSALFEIDMAVVARAYGQ